MRYDDLEHAKMSAPDEIRAHMLRIRQFQAGDRLQVAVVFHDSQPPIPMRTLAMFTQRQDAEDFVRGDPFVLKGMVEEWHIRESHDLLA